MSSSSPHVHVLVIPLPLQGHVNPLMAFSRCLAERGFKITFVITQVIHNRIMSAMAHDKIMNSNLDDRIRLVSIPDGLASEEDRNDFHKFFNSILCSMPSKLEELLNSINASNNNDDENMITCVIADPFMFFALEVAHKMGIRRAILWPISATVFAMKLSIPRLIDEGIIDGDGFPIERKTIQLSSDMPPMDTTSFPWTCFSDLATQKGSFEYSVKCIQTVNIADWCLCNTAYELELATFSLSPKLLPIGPLIASPRIGNSGAQFWPEDSTCLDWLDQQAAHSVIYIAFGSLIVFNQTQFDELAYELGLSNRPFLWVVHQRLTNESNRAQVNGFQGNQGKIVDWAPQQKVLSHPAIACFLTHCGWNSTMEGLMNGIPFLCWPQFADQFSNQSYICDVWKVGVRLDIDENGIILREEVKKKVDQLLDDENIRRRCLELKEIVIDNINEGGGSSKNLNDFIEWLKA